MAVIGLIAGIAVAYKLFDQTVPNNVVRDASRFDYTIHKWDGAFENTNSNNQAEASEYVLASGTNPIFRTDPLPAGPNLYPGDSRTTNVRITNTHVMADGSGRDASFQTYVTNIRVADVWDEVNNVPQAPVIIPNTDPGWNYFVNLFTLTVDKATVMATALGDLMYDGSFTNACQTGLQALTAQSPCELGTIRAAGDESFLIGDPMDVRDYTFNIAEADDGTDQSAYKGWEVRFDLVFQARVPAVDDAVVLIGERA